MNLLLYIAIVFGFNQAVTNSVSSAKFTQMKPTMCGPVRLSSGWVDKSRSSCAANCKARYPEECQSFLYNNFTKLCTPAKGLSSNQQLPTIFEGDLYYHHSPEFNMFTSGSSTVNVAYFTNKLTYTDAESACVCLDAHLYAPDNGDKVSIIGNVAIPRDYIWIGLDDIAVEGKLVWTKNGQEIDAMHKTAIFMVGQPDNTGNQDCVCVFPDSYTFDDEQCLYSLAYICERK